MKHLNYILRQVTRCESMTLCVRCRNALMIATTMRGEVVVRCRVFNTVRGTVVKCRYFVEEKHESS